MYNFFYFFTILLSMYITLSYSLIIDSHINIKLNKYNKNLFVVRFKKSLDNNEISNGNIISSIWNGIKRFLPKTSRVTIAENYDIPNPDSGYRYHLRLVNGKIADRRHIITRLRRYLPDLSWETAEQIVDTSIEEEIALVRVFNSKVSWYIR